MPKVSVIIPTYNRAVLLRSAINSVLSQSYEDYEIIVVDDGSTDDTEKIVNELSTDKLRYVYQENKGRSAARNYGIKLARGEYVAFLDSDDTFTPSKLEFQVQILDYNPCYGLVYSYAKIIDENGDYLNAQYEGNLSGWIYPDLLFIRNNVITTPTVMVRARILAELGGFDESMDICEDLDLWCRIAREYQVKQICQPLAIIRIRSSEQINILEFMAGRTRYYKNAISQNPHLYSIKNELYSEMYYAYLDLAIAQKNKMVILYLVALAFINDPKQVILSLLQRLKKLGFWSR